MTFLEIDSSNQVHRLFHGCPPLSSNSGIETHALMGWVRLLSGVVKKANLPSNTVVVTFWDKAPKKGVEPAPQKEELWFDYKGKRVKDENTSIRDQLILSMAVTKLLGIRMVYESGVEADSLLGSYVLNKPEDDHFILSSDKDMLQLVNSKVNVLSANGPDFKKMTPEGVMAKWGVRPDQMADLLILMGDKSDNIPGVPGIGIKTAQELLGKYGSLEAVLKSLGDLKPKQRQTLTESAERIPVLRKLIEFEPAPVRVRQVEPDYKAAKEMLAGLQMVVTIPHIATLQIEHMKKLARA